MLTHVAIPSNSPDVFISSLDLSTPPHHSSCRLGFTFTTAVYADTVWGYVEFTYTCGFTTVYTAGSRRLCSKDLFWASECIHDFTAEPQSAGSKQVESAGPAEEALWVGSWTSTSKRKTGGPHGLR